MKSDKKKNIYRNLRFYPFQHMKNENKNYKIIKLYPFSKYEVTKNYNG